EVREDPREPVQPRCDRLHERLAVLLIRDAAALAEPLHVARVVLADDLVRPRGAAEIERRARRAEDLVEMRGHPPPVAVALQELERERGAYENVGVERIGTDARREVGRRDAR